MFDLAITHGDLSKCLETLFFAGMKERCEGWVDCMVGGKQRG